MIESEPQSEFGTRIDSPRFSRKPIAMPNLGEITRRQFLNTSATALAAAALSDGVRPLHAADQRTPVVDMHEHCFAGKDDVRFPYSPQGPYRPEKGSSPEQLLRCMDEAGVDGAVIVHPEPYQDDHRYLTHCLGIGKDRFRGTCLFFAGRPDSLPRMKQLVEQHPKQIIALRFHAYAADRLPPFGKPEMRELWKGAADLGLAVQLHLQPKFAPGFEPLIREFSQTKVIIDHMGRPFQGMEQEHQVVLGWSKLPNTIMKIASLPEPEEQPQPVLVAMVKRLTDAFGAERMIYGGGFNENATGKTYRQFRERVEGLLTHLSAADRAQILGGTATRLFGFRTVS